MIKFFRKIRQKLLSDLPAGKAGNKFSKYLIYAFGEIILVMIGILLALQVSNWNERRIKKQKEAKFIVQIHDEFLQNRVQFDLATSYHKRVRSGCNNIIALMPIDIDAVNMDSLSSYLKDTYWFWTFNPQQTSINTLTSTSAFDIISDPELKAQLESWNGLLNDYSEEEGMSRTFATNSYLPYMRKRITNRGFENNGNLLDHKNVQLDFLNDLEFENLVIARKVLINDILNETKSVDEAIDKIIELTSPE